MLGSTLMHSFMLELHASKIRPIQVLNRQIMINHSIEKPACPINIYFCSNFSTINYELLQQIGRLVETLRDNVTLTYVVKLCIDLDVHSSLS